MATYEFNENVKFILPAGFVFTRDEDDEGNESVSIKTGEYENDDGETDYKYSWLIKYKEYDSEEADEGFTSDKLIDWMVERMEATKYMRLPGTPRSILMTKAMPVTVFGRMLKMFVSLCMFQVDDWAAMQLIHTGRYNDDDPYSNTERYENFYEVLKSVRIKGEKLPLEGISASDIEEALYLTFEEEGDAIDVSPTLKINVSVGNQTASYEYTSAGMKKVGQFSFTEVEPDEELYPHYSSIKNNPLRFFPGAVINATGTEFEFHRLDSAYDFESDDKQKQIQEICELNPSGYSLAEIAKEMIPVFRVDKEIFDPKHDRECELLNNYMRRAYMMSALRSFAWTLADYCEEHDTSPEDIDSSLPSRIANFVASRDWLNYDGDSYCQGLCSGSDLHVYFFPDAVSEVDKKTFLPSQDDYDRIEEMKASFPSYREILCEVHSLEALRKDLEYIYPAVRILYDELKEARDTSVPLEGNESDIVYAWIALAIAAEFPFFSEDGPMGYAFSWPGEDYKERAKEEEAVYAQREYEAWMNKYEEYIEKDPLIDFDGTLFVFSGLGRGHAGEKDDPIVQMVIEKGGQYRSKVSGITNYLVVDPWHSGYSKIDAAIEQNDNGKHIKIILLEDLEKALGVNPSSEKPSASAKKSTSSSNPSKKRNVTGLKDFEIDESGTLIKYKGDDRDIILPNGITAIGEMAFLYNGITSVIIPEGVESIGRSAFSHCKVLKNVVLPSTLKTICDNAFGSCEQLTDINIPEGVEVINRSTFSECKHLKSILLPSTLRKIGSYAFGSCEQLTDINLPEGVESIGDFVFSDCTSVKTVVLPSTLRTIGEYAFSSCEQLTDINIPEGVEIIAKNAFGNCARLTGIKLPSALKALGSSAFYSCEQLTDINIPEGVESLEDDTFYGCESLKTIEFSNNLRSLGESAFGCCKQLETICIPEGVETIGKRAFWCCESLKTVSLPSSIRVIGEEAFYSCKSLVRFIIPNGCEEIGEKCFYSSNIEDIYIPASVNKLGDEALPSTLLVHTPKNSVAEDWAKKKGRKVVNNSAPSKQEEISDFEIDDGVLIKYRGDSEDIVLPAGIKTIDDDIFFENERISSITIPEGVEEICRCVFYKCKNLKSVTLPNSIRKIGSYSFYHAGILSIVIPSGCTEIGDDCFVRCIDLDDIFVPSSVTDIGENAFSTCNRDTVIHTEKNSAAEAYAIEKKMKVEYDYALDGTAASNISEKTSNSSSSSLYAKESMSDFEIDEWGTLVNYKGASEDLVLPEGIKAIGDYAFEENETITTIVIPEGVETIERQAFGWCTNLKKVTFPRSLRRIGKEAFFSCDDISSIVIPDGCIEIGEDCFSDCGNLEDIYLPASVCTIGKGAFHYFMGDEKKKIHTVKDSFAETYAKENNLYVDYSFTAGRSTTANRASSSALKPSSKTGMTQNKSNYRMTEPEQFDDLDNETLVESKAVFKPSTSNSASNSTSSSLNSKPQQTAPTKKEGCYIATAVYGSYDAPQVVTLRKFRDETLSNTVFGRWFIRTYYRLSPPIAEKLKNANRINRFVRYILDRWVDKLNSEQ